MSSRSPEGHDVDMSRTDRFNVTATRPDEDPRTAQLELPEAVSRDARSVIRHLTRLTRRLPARIDVVVVSIPSIENLTVDLLAGIAISRRVMAAHGRQLTVGIPGRPDTPGAAALLDRMPFVMTP